MKGQKCLSSSCVLSKEVLDIYTDNHTCARDLSCWTNQVSSTSMQRCLTHMKPYMFITDYFILPLNFACNELSSPGINYRADINYRLPISWSTICQAILYD